ncbi:hypothetical protein P7C71_g3564, partial [Lecanoromycetidae sp. Uapishka_2]
MSACSDDQDPPLPASESSHSQPLAWVLNWLQQTHTPDPCLLSSQDLQVTPTRGSSNRRPSDTSPTSKSPRIQSSHKRRKILHEMSGNVGADAAAQYATPNKSTSTQSEPPRTPGNASPSKPRPIAKPRQDPASLGYRMSLHGLKCDDYDAYNAHPLFRQHIEKIVLSDRSSAMRPASVRKFHDRLHTYGTLNEQTFLHNMIPILMKDGCHVLEKQVHTTPEEQGETEKTRLVYKDFLDEERILVTLSDEFTRTLLPSKYNSPEFEADMAKALEKQDGMTNPKPDFAYGLMRDKFPLSIHDAPIPPDVTALLEIVPHMHHPFLIIEGKADAGSAAQAENQARRGGATLVNAGRMLRSIVMDEEEDMTTPDLNTFVFSVTICPTVLNVWVHWYDGSGGDQRFHMNQVASYALRNLKGPIEIRQTLHNIMEWGAISRTAQIEALVESIHAYSKRKHEKYQADVRASKASKAENAKRRRMNGSTASGLDCQ